jgi:hypothetical protein
VTLMPELPSVTQSVADLFAVSTGSANLPAPATIPVAMVPLRKSRLESRNIDIHLLEKIVSY